jgi:serine/threonine-protein kinase
VTLTRLQIALGDAYVLEREVGRGGMATVYLARDIKHDRRVALKVLDPELGAVLGAERFLSEIRVTANLQHPNLLPLFDSGEADGLLYYVMPFVEGQSLRQRLDLEKQLPVDEAVRIAVAVANALDYAHQHQVIHRDLKPENILLQHGQPVVADFGIALAVSNAGGARVTQTGLSLGTPQYMSPEQATGDRAIDGRTDIYSLAAVTYEMLAGEPPHTGTSAQAIIAKLMTTEPQPVRTLRPSVPANVAMAVEHGLAKLPADRFASAKAFSDALINTSFTTSLQSAPAPVRRRRRVEIVLGAVTALSLVVAAWSLARRNGSAPVRRYNIELDSAESLIQTARWGRIAISPDGSTIAYVSAKGTLMLRRRDELHAKPIPGAENSGAPTFSPDGKHVAFIQNAAKLMIVALDGTLPVFVTDSLVGLSGLAWAPDDVIYADGAGSTPLVRVAARAGAKPQFFAVLDTAAGEVDEVFPSVLPGGESVLFTSQIRPRDGSASHHVAEIADRKTGEHHIILDDARVARYVPGHLVYVTRAGALMATRFDLSARRVAGDPVLLADGLPRDLNMIDLAVSQTGTLLYVSGAAGVTGRNLVWVGRDGKEQPVDTSWHGGFADPSFSPDGKRLAIASGVALADLPSNRDLNAESSIDIWVRRMEDGVVAKLSIGGGVNRFPVWSADGKSVVYAGAGNGDAIIEKQADGGTPPVVRLKADRRIASVAETPDREWLIYQVSSGALNMHLFARHRGDTVSVPLFGLKTATGMPSLSPDGKWLAYVSNETGPPEVFVVPFPNVTSAKWQVSRDTANDPHWSNKGDELLYREHGFLTSVRVSTRPTFSQGTPKRLFPAALYARGFAIEHDDLRFLMVRMTPADSRSQLSVFENWTTTMNRK